MAWTRRPDVPPWPGYQTGRSEAQWRAERGAGAAEWDREHRKQLQHARSALRGAVAGRDKKETTRLMEIIDRLEAGQCDMPNVSGRASDRVRSGRTVGNIVRPRL